MSPEVPAKRPAARVTPKARIRRMGLAAVERSHALAALFGRGYLLRLRLPRTPPSADPGPRYGYGSPPHRRLGELLARGDGEYRELLHAFAAYTEALQAIPLSRSSAREPHWRNGFLFGIDAASLYCLIRQRAPRRYMEVGSGNSTLFADRARRDGGLETEIFSIDVQPRREIDAICDRVVREPLESIDLAPFAELTAGDVVFMDGTHRVFTNSDPVVFFLDVLPELAPGVLVGIHDIHLPDDYQPEHTDRYYSEQYLLASYLLAESPWLHPVLPCWYVSHHPELAPAARGLVPDGFSAHGVTFWLQTAPRGA